MKRPLIGITTESTFEPDTKRTRGKISVNWNYPEMIHEAGGLPMIIPPMADMSEIAERIDGWLITGGEDICASRWGEDNHPASTVNDDSRTAGEMRLWSLIQPSLPVLGICYGCQFLNVASGGSLQQHLPDVVDTEHTGGALQTVGVASPSAQAKFGGAGEVTGQSWHHQSVERLGDQIQVAGKHPDGTVEIIERTDRPWVLGVQWHPERTPQDPATLALFRSFVEAAIAYREAQA